MSRKISIALSFFLLSTTFGLNHDASAEEEIPEWGFYVYMAGDNTLYDELTDDLNEMKMVGSNEDLEIVALTDKIDDLHYYTLYVKYGIGRTTYDASQEIRNNHITREEGLALVKRFEGEFPDKYFNEIMEFIDMNPEQFHMLCDDFRPPHLWKKVGAEWRLRHNSNQTGVDD